MSDLSVLGGALGLSTPSYDPQEAKGYLSELGQQSKQTQQEYNDLVQQRRAKVNQMQQIVEDATNALLNARKSQMNLPLLAAGSAMMMPTSTGGLGASFGQAGLSAAPYIAADRRDETEDTLRSANLKTLPLTMGEGVDKDVMAQLATRQNQLEAQRSAVTRGTLTAQTTGMKAVQKEINDIRKQAALEAKNQMAAAQRSGATYEGDDAEVERQLTESIYAQMFHQRYGVWPGQATAGRDLTPQEIEHQVPRMPKQIQKETKQERDAYTAMSQAGQTAEQNLSSLQFAEPSTGPQTPGLLSGPALWASKVAEAFGVEGEWGKKISDAGTDVGKMQAVMRNFVLDMQKQQKGVQTEGDAKRMAEAIGNTTNTAQLNKLMFSWMRSQALATKYQADVADEYVKGNKNRATGINAFVNDKARLPIVRPGANGAKVTLWDYVNAYQQQNPNLRPDEAQRKAIDMWNSLGG